MKKSERLTEKQEYFLSMFATMFYQNLKITASMADISESQARKFLRGQSLSKLLATGKAIETKMNLDSIVDKFMIDE